MRVNPVYVQQLMHIFATNEAGRYNKMIWLKHMQFVYDILIYVLAYCWTDYFDLIMR